MSRFTLLPAASRSGDLPEPRRSSMLVPLRRSTCPDSRHVDRDVGGAARQRPAERRRSLGGGENIQRPEMRSGETLERRAEQDVDLGNVVGAEQLHLRQEVRIDLAVREGRTENRER